MKTTKQEKITHVALSIWAAIALIAVLSLGCTQERPLEKSEFDKTSTKEKPISKKFFDTNAEYLYLPSSLNSSRTTDATFPMYMGEGKIVKLQLAEDSLRVVAVDPETEFGDNPVNSKPILTIPIKHVDYRCATDRDGQCLQKEEEDISKPWAKRKFVKLLVDQLAVQEINFLPVEIKNLFSSCYETIGSNFESLKIEEDAINFGIEKTYKSGLHCANQINDISDLTFRVVYKYSLVKLDKLTTPNYKSFTYSRKEEQTFGYFDTDTFRLDRDNNSSESGRKKFLNRWAPTRKVVYYLSDNFNKPEYAKIKVTTQQAVESINHSLELAGAQLRIELKDATADHNPGDLRVNTIVMVEDPVNYGILGYGPTAANPRTGEIVHGRTAMYMGVMKTGIKRTYEEFVKEYQKKRGANKSSAKDTPAVSLAAHLVPKEEPGPTKSRTAHVADRSPAELRPDLSVEKVKAHAERLVERRLTVNHLALLLRESQKHDHDELDLNQLAEVDRIREQLMSTHCFYSVDNFNVNSAVEIEIQKIIAQVEAKPWAELTEHQKDRVIHTLLPFVWRPVLIHELGHNLGLRHNFAGSEDKDNFYTQEELTRMGATRTFDYSSVMDYGYRYTNELQVMGKYDIAALRFGYAEQIQIAGSEVKFASVEEIRKKPDLKVKEYRYCTDEHVDVNPGCKRFDEGTSLTEIAQHWIQSYEENYLRRNFRNGVDSFSQLDDLSYIRRMRLTFDSLRSAFERYEDIKKTYRLTDDHEVWTTVDFLKDLKSATKLAGQFFVKVLQTPDVLCAVANAKQPNQILALVPIRQISSNAISCFDKENLQLNEQFVSVGQTGKSFQSRKDPHSTNPYMDQIDVRGIWIDKIIATHALTGRLTGISSFDEFTDNLLDVADLRSDMQSAISSMLLDETVADVTIKTADGQELNAKLPVQMYSAEAGANGHKILKPLHPVLQRVFRIPSEGVDFQPYIAQVVKQNAYSAEERRDANSLYNSLLAYEGLPTGTSPDNFISTDIGLTRIFAHSKSLVASQLVRNREAITLLSSIEKPVLEAIVKKIISGEKLSDSASEVEKQVYALKPELIARFLNDDFQDVKFYEIMLGAIAQ